MKFGISVPNFGSYAEPDRVVALAVAAERGGWDGFFVWDHIVISDGMPVADPWVLLGAVAEATSDVKIGPMVAALPRHRPWVVARQAVSIDRLSGGRMILGVGIGFPPAEEFGTFGEPEDARVRADMLDEGLAIIEGVWSGRRFGFEGGHYRVKPTSFQPPPVQNPRIPIWVAAMLPANRPLRRAARFDGVFPINADFSNMTVADVERTLRYIIDHRQPTTQNSEPTTQNSEPTTQNSEPTTQNSEPTTQNSEPTTQFDFVIGGPPRTASEFEELESAGVTWYLGGPHESESFEETIEWVGDGPATYRT